MKCHTSFSRCKNKERKKRKKRKEKKRTTTEVLCSFHSARKSPTSRFVTEIDRNRVNRKSAMRIGVAAASEKLIHAVNLDISAESRTFKWNKNLIKQIVSVITVVCSVYRVHSSTGDSKYSRRILTKVSFEVSTIDCFVYA